MGRRVSQVVATGNLGVFQMLYQIFSFLIQGLYVCEAKYVVLKNLPTTIFSNDACMIKYYCKQTIKNVLFNKILYGFILLIKVLRKM